MAHQKLGKTGVERTILDNLSTAVLLFGSDLRLVYINPAGEMLLAVSAKYVVGQQAGEIISCPGGELEWRLTEAARTKHPFTETEMNLPLGDGRTITVSCTVLPLAHDESLDALLIELRQVDRQLRITREEQLISQHQASQALIRGLAHEIKNPLGGLRGAAQLLEQELDDRSLREYTRIIIEEADRLQSLMNQMLGPNRMPRLGRVNIHSVMEHVRGLLIAESPQGPDIRRDYDPSIPDLEGDQDRLVQAVLNIARNAATAAGQSGVVVLRTRVLRQFTIGPKRYRLVLRAEIEDNGPGIPDSLKDRIFFPMVSSQVGGTGLGLPIAQELINQHGGFIECDSVPGRTAFFVYLPLEPENE